LGDSTARNLVLLNLHWEGCMESKQSQFGILPVSYCGPDRKLLKILSRDRMIIDGGWIGNWIY
jgi:hypothetical protein